MDQTQDEHPDGAGVETYLQFRIAPKLGMPKRCLGFIAAE